MRNFYITLGVWLLIIPALGISGVWKNRLVVATGVLVLAESIWPILIKKVSVKPRVKKKPKPKEETEMTFSQTDQNVTKENDTEEKA